MPAEPNSTPPRLASLSVDDLAQLLRVAGSQQASPSVIRSDLAAGAPVNADGTVNLIVYAAWLVRELARRESARG